MRRYAVLSPAYLCAMPSGRLALNGEVRRRGGWRAPPYLSQEGGRQQRTALCARDEIGGRLGRSQLIGGEVYEVTDILGAASAATGILEAEGGDER